MVGERAERDLILLNLADGQYFALDPVGTLIWDLCDGTHSVRDIAAAVMTAYEAPAHTVETDVLELLGDLAASGLVTTGVG